MIPLSAIRKPRQKAPQSATFQHPYPRHGKVWEVSSWAGATPTAWQVRCLQKVRGVLDVMLGMDQVCVVQMEVTRHACLLSLRAAHILITTFLTSGEMSAEQLQSVFKIVAPSGLISIRSHDSNTCVKHQVDQQGGRVRQGSTSSHTSFVPEVACGSLAARCLAP